MNNNNRIMQEKRFQLQPLPFMNLNCEIRHIFFKRVFDVCFSLFILILGFPLFFIIGIIVRCTSRGPIFYFQERIGRGGTPFKCYKFRTMHPNAEERLQTILSSDPSKLEEWQDNHKLKNDPRITSVGNFLRRTSLDELPQFWNVIKGDLSVVGPRPVVYEEILRHYGPKAHKILSIRPGLTGIWQVSGRGNTGYARRILLDEQYVETRSFLMDIKIILKTIPSMISAKGAF